MSKKNTIVGKIYAEWCGHCQNLKPEWYKMKTKLEKMGKLGKNKQITIVEINESETQKLDNLKAQYKNLYVNGYPTIFKIHPNGSIEYYSGDRTAPEMQKWALQKQKMGGKQTFRRKKKLRKTVKLRRFFGLF